MDRVTILDDCLARLKAGASIADCLSQYPGQAAELAPILAAAVQLQDLSGHALSDAQRLRAKVMLRETLASRLMPRAATSWLGLFGRAKSWAAAGVVALVLFAVLSAGAVAASQPGDLTYGVRVTAERAPALLLRDPARRADAELDAADRRLTDVRHAFQSARPAIPTVLEALIAGDEAAAAQASRLSEPARLQAAERVEAHAATLSLLAESASEARAAEALAAAAARARVIAARVRMGQPGIPPPPTGRPTIAAPAPVRTHADIAVRDAYDHRLAHADARHDGDAHSAGDERSESRHRCAADEHAGPATARRYARALRHSIATRSRNPHWARHRDRCHPDRAPVSHRHTTIRHAQG